MASISLPVALLGGAAVSAGATMLGSNAAANAQKSAANTAANTQMSMYNQSANRLAPFVGVGSTAATNAQNMAKTGFSFNPTMSQLEQTPGYQFNLQQGLKSVQNGAAARGLGVSGAALRAGADYASGLASNTYQQQFNNALTGYQTNFGNQMNLAGLGENAAAQTGYMGQGAANQISSAQIGAGNAQAGAYMASANAVGSGVNNALAGYLYAGQSGMLGGGGGLFGGGALGAAGDDMAVA